MPRLPRHVCRIVMASDRRDVVVVTAPQCGQTAPPCRNADAEAGASQSPANAACWLGLARQLALAGRRCRIATGRHRAACLSGDRYREC